MKTAEEMFNNIPFLDKDGDFFNVPRETVIKEMKTYGRQCAEQALKDAADKFLPSASISRGFILSTPILTP